MKRNILILVIALLLLIAGVFVFAQGAIPPGLISVFGPVPLVSCSESDGGANIYVHGVNYVSYLFNGTLQNVSGSEYCLNNNTLVEGVCSSWINANFNMSLNTSGYAVTFNCSSSNIGNLSYTCFNGACVLITVPQPPTNNTNLSLPDLTVNLSIKNIQNNSGQFLVNYSITYKNIGNAASPLTQGSFLQQGPVGGGGGNLIVPPLTAGQMITTYNPQTISGPNNYGLWTASITVDSSNLIPELNENNNNASLTFII